MMQLKNYKAITFVLLLTASGMYAQNLGASRFSGSVNQLGSDGFVIANNGRQQTYQTSTIPAHGVALQNADMIQTGPGDYVEVQLDPSGAIIKLAENTTVVFSDLGSSSRPALISFLYGRMRIVNPDTKGTVTVQAGNALIEIYRGDMALDFATIPGSANKQPQLQVSTFSGAGQVVSSVATPGAAKTPLYEHETVIFDVATRLAVITRQPLNQEITAYWSRNGFRQVGAAPQNVLVQGTRPTLPALGAYPVGATPASSGDVSGQSTSTGFPTSTQTSVPGVTRRDPIKGFDYDVMSDARATIPPKNNGVLVGTLLAAGGVLLQALSHYEVLGVAQDVSDTMYAVGYAPIALGIVVLVATYAYSYRN
jgi:hypothetical protein